MSIKTLKSKKHGSICLSYESQRKLEEKMSRIVEDFVEKATEYGRRQRGGMLDCSQVILELIKMVKDQQKQIDTLQNKLSDN
jgi:hypothetical protein